MWKRLKSLFIKREDGRSNNWAALPVQIASLVVNTARLLIELRKEL